MICCSWGWWLEHQQRLPLPGQLVAATLPIASLEDPLTAARVAALRLRGRDWFRELLLPEALSRLQLIRNPYQVWMWWLPPATKRVWFSVLSNDLRPCDTRRIACPPG